jgi:hypothetical protein
MITPPPGRAAGAHAIFIGRVRHKPEPDAEITMSERYVRIYVVQPPEAGAEWAVRVDSDKPVRFRHEKDALSYALRQARSHTGQGVSVELRVEDDHGHWRSMAL